MAVWHLLLAEPHTDLEYPPHGSVFHSPSRGSSSKLSFVFVTQVKFNLFETGNCQRLQQLVIYSASDSGRGKGGRTSVCHESQRRPDGSLVPWRAEAVLVVRTFT